MRGCRVLTRPSSISGKPVISATSVTVSGFFGFAAAKVLTLGLAKAGSGPTRDSLVQALESLGEVDLGGFVVRYGPGDRVGSNYVDSTIITREGHYLR